MKPARADEPAVETTRRADRPTPHPFLPFDWSNRKLWALEVPIEEAPVTELAWHLDEPLWSTVAGDRRFDLRPSAVLAAPQRYPEHAERIERADLRFPLDLVWTDGRYVIVDGVHRLAKAHRLGWSRIAVRRMPEALVPEIESPEETDD